MLGHHYRNHSERAIDRKTGFLVEGKDPEWNLSQSMSLAVQPGICLKYTFTFWILIELLYELNCDPRKSGMDRRGTLHRGTMLRHSRVNHERDLVLGFFG